MKPVIIYEQDTRTIVNHHNKRFGDDFVLVHPYEVNFKVVWQDDPDQTTFSNKREYVHRAELIVTDCVWKEIKKTGKYLENIEETIFIHKNKIKNGLDIGEHNFLNAYKGRFLYLRNDVANEKFAEYYIYDNVDFNFKGANLYKNKKLNDFKEFKAKLKELKLI